MMTTDERGPIETRSGTVTDVSWPERVIDLIVVPYDEPAVVEYKGRLVEETVAPGAFGALSNRSRKFLVNADHDESVWLGTVLSLDGLNERGLRAAVKIRQTPAGDQALVDAADGLLGASIGMAVGPKDQSFSRGPRGETRRIHKAYLAHVALTPTPAYVGAEVLEVRTHLPTVEPPLQEGATPNLDRARALISAWTSC